MSDNGETEEIIYFLTVVTSFGRVTQPCIQTQSVFIAASPNVNGNPGPSLQNIGGECAVSQPSNINDDSVVEVVADQILSVSLTSEESSDNQLTSVP